MAATSYSFSFLSGALYLKETLALAELLRTHGDWNVVNRLAIEENLLRQRTAGSRTRLLREVRHRLKEFTPDELEFFCNSSPNDQRLMLFVAVCQHFRFIREFVEEVLRPKTLALDFQLYPADYARFFDRKGSEAPEVERLTDKSRAKVKQVLIRMLAEAGLLDSTASQRIRQPVPSKALVQLLSIRDARRLRFLLLAGADIRKPSP
jgi:hypothetical protein